MSKYWVFSDPYFHAFGLNTKIYSVNLWIQSEYKKLRSRKTSLFGKFSSSVFVIFSFACQYSLQCYWYCYNQKQSSDAVLQKLYSYTNSKNSQENIRKEIPAQMFPCEFWEIFHKIFLKEPLGRLLHYKHSFCLLSDHGLSPFRKRCHTYFLAEYFFGLICRLETRVNSIFQALNQNPASKNTL